MQKIFSKKKKMFFLYFRKLTFFVPKIKSFLIFFQKKAFLMLEEKELCIPKIKT